MAETDIYDATCPPRSAAAATAHAGAAVRGAPTSPGFDGGRIAIIKQRQGKRLRARGFTNRYLAVAWSILGHNLWLIARLLADQPPQAQAA
ncbi:MAG: hypothetical protein J6386_24970 [Candidatus Synoicihabitans palmerolidicus]|nr:hypothetical protein [Candidatus Synoicihabitans palmerolidicus]